MTPSPTELTTAGTDAILALVCLLGLVALRRLRIPAGWKRPIWASVLILLALGSAIGAVAHGIEWPAAAQLVLRRSLFPILGLAVAMFVLGAIADWRGRNAARAARPWAIAAGIAALGLPFLSDSGFELFVAYEAAGMIGALIIYVNAWREGRAGAGTVATGIMLTLLAAVVQQSGVRANLVWSFDHNGLFHIIQLIALVVTARGIRLSLTAPNESRT